MRRKSLLFTLWSYLLIFPFISSGQNVPTGEQSPVVATTAIPAGYSNTTNFSFIREWIPRIPIKDASAVTSSARTIREVEQATTYYDAGTPIQFVQKGRLPGGKDLVKPYYYDSIGRDTRHYLPYAAPGDGLLKTDPFAQQLAAYHNIPGYENENYLYSSTTVENGPLGRVLQSAIPGNGYVGKNVGKQYEYGINHLNDSVRILRVGDSAVLTPFCYGIYGEGELSKITSVDENGDRVIEYQDKEKKTVLRKVQIDVNPSTGHAGWLCSYVVCNDFGQVRLEISPRAVDELESNGWLFTNPDIINKLCNQYSFDAKGRTIVKKGAGIDPEFLVFDQRDRLVFSQDGNQRKDSIWIVLFYDQQDRMVMTAEYKSLLTSAQLQQRMDTVSISNSVTIGYRVENPADLVLNGNEEVKANYAAENSITLLPGLGVGAGSETLFALDTTSQLVTQTVTSYFNPLPGVTSYKPISIFHYDNYDWPAAKKFDAGYISKLDAGGQSYAIATVPDYNTVGKLTGKELRIMVAGKEQWVASTYYFNKRDWTIQSFIGNIKSGVSVITSQYNFTGDILSQYFLHSNPASKTNPVTTILTKYQYDDWRKLKVVSQALNGGTQKTLSLYDYDSLGRLKTKTLADLDVLVYNYNAVGRLTGINQDYARNGGSSYFGIEMSYEYGFSNNQKNGNLAGQTWRRKGDNQYRSYGYKYDKAGRFLQADYAKKEGGSWSQANENCSVNNLSYDKNGNIRKMDVYATVLGATKAVDRLNYSYESISDKLTDVIDSAGYQQQEDFKGGNHTGALYSYDANGNTVVDHNKGLTYVWNSVIDKNTEVILDSSQKRVQLIYDAEGNRWNKNIIDGSKLTSYTYIDGFVYRNDTLLYFDQPGGRVRRNTKGALVYDYYESDPLGNTRAIITEDRDTTFYANTYEDGRVVQETATFTKREETKEEIPTNLAWYNATNNKYWSRLNGSVADKRVGSGIILKVMAGDVIDLRTKAYYKNDGTNTNPASVDQIITDLVGAFLGSGSSTVPNGKGNLQQGNGSILNTADLNAFTNTNQQNNNDLSSAPKAYLNYLLFDANFNLVGGYVKRVDGSADSLVTYNGHVDVTKSGYLVAYTSNESPRNVWFDDIEVTHQSGPLLQESTLYPYGMEIASQSNRPIIQTANVQLFQGKELDEEFDINTYDFGSRTYDPQTGRFISPDPARQFASGYVGMGNNPVMFTDPDGRIIPLLIMAAGAVIGGVTNVVSHWDEISSAPNLTQAILRGAGYTVVGGVSGAMYATGNVTGGAAFSAVGNGVMDLISGHSFENAAGGAFMGLVTAPIAGAASSAVSQAAAPLLRYIPSVAIRTAVDMGISQAIGTAAAGTGVGMMSGQTLDQALENSLPGALMAGATGSVGGFVYGFAWSRMNRPEPVSAKFDGSLEKVQTVQINTEISTALEGPALPRFTMVADQKSVPDGSFYSVVFETELPTNLYPGGRYDQHFKSANTSLSNAIKSDPAFGRMMSNLGVVVPTSNAGTIVGKSPVNYVWHHDINIGIMQLVPKSQHPSLPGGIFWGTMHPGPGGSGGMSMWGK